VAIESFEGNNLVLVDEGHRGSGGDKWKDKRNRLCESGFSFEYSATFGQAVHALAGAKQKILIDVYQKPPYLFSYRYFTTMVMERLSDSYLEPKLAGQSC
jgi:hypothetical protein